LPDVGELAHTQFITAMLIALAVPCGRPQAQDSTSDPGSGMGADSIRQARSDALTRTGQRPLTCVDEPEQAARTQARPADKEEAGGSSPLRPTQFKAVLTLGCRSGGPIVRRATLPAPRRSGHGISGAPRAGPWPWGAPPACRARRCCDLGLRQEATSPLLPWSSGGWRVLTRARSTRRTQSYLNEFAFCFNGAGPGPGTGLLPHTRARRQLRPGAVTATWSLTPQPRQAPPAPPSVRGHDIPAAINSPGQPAGARSFARAQRPEVISAHSPAAARHRVCRMADPQALVRSRRRAPSHDPRDKPWTARALPAL
jgi:hypothetical protein